MECHLSVSGPFKIFLRGVKFEFLGVCNLRCCSYGERLALLPFEQNYLLTLGGGGGGGGSKEVLLAGYCSTLPPEPTLLYVMENMSRAMTSYPYHLLKRVEVSACTCSG